MSQGKKNFLVVILYFSSMFFIFPLIYYIFLKNKIKYENFLVYQHFIIFFIIFLLTKNFLYNEFIKFKTNLKANINKIFYGYGLLFLGSIVLSLIYGFILKYYNIEFKDSSNQELIIEIAHYSPIYIFMLTVIFAPFSEEIVFRLGIFKSLKKYNRILAYLISILIFSIIHILPEVFVSKNVVLTFMQFLTYLWPTIIITFNYDKNDNIIIPIGIHVFNNLMGILMILLNLDL